MSFYNTRVNGNAGLASANTQETEIIAGNDVVARASYPNEARSAFTVTYGPDRPAAPFDQLFQRHSDGSIWESQRERLPERWRLHRLAGARQQRRYHIDQGRRWHGVPAPQGREHLEWTGGGCQAACRNWLELDENSATSSISAGDGTVFQLHKDGSIWRSTGQPCTSYTACPGWTKLDDNPRAVSISAGDGSVFQLHKDGSIWQSTGQPCTSATACPGWTELDDNPATVAINAATVNLYQRHKDGSLWRSTGQPCTSATACPGWTELDDNASTVGMSGGAYFYQRHSDGSIWESTGQPCVRAALCPGWTELDDNPGTVAISAGLFTVYQLHKDGSVWRSTGAACTSATSCPGWTKLDNNQGTVQISVSNGSLARPRALWPTYLSCPRPRTLRSACAISGWPAGCGRAGPGRVRRRGSRPRAGRWRGQGRRSRRATGAARRRAG